MSGEPRWDVAVVGAGPAGSTAAALLARRGLSVVVLEKSHFPRFHIGESLLPAGLSVLARLGVEPHADAFLRKRGAEFLCEASGRRGVFSFDGALPGLPDHSFHVDRARFDTLLRDVARAAGAEVRHGEAVLEAELDASDAVHVRTASDRLAARYLIDATGQDRLLAQQSRSVEPYRAFGAAAVFTHFAGLRREALDELGPGFAIRVLLRPDGWGWIIPLPGARLSVGLVSQERATHAQLDALLADPLAARCTAGAERLATHVASNFSYRNTASCGPRFACIGDAACFLDPVFSSGVTLALRGAESLADAIGPALQAGTETEPGLLDAHRRSMDRAYRTFGALIGRFYNSRFAESVFLGDTDGMPMRAGVLSVLAGDVWRDDNPFQDQLLAARRGQG